MSTIRTAAIFGATGAIGTHLGSELDRRGIPFRAVGRRKARLEETFGALPRAEIREADAADIASATAALRGADTVFYTLGLPYPQHRLHPVLMRNTLQAAEAAGVARLVLVSSVYPFGVPRTARVAETHPRVPCSRKGEYRKQQEDLVLEAHAKGSIAASILRLPDFYGPGADLSLAHLIFQAAVQGKTATWLGPAGTPHEFVYVPDTAPVLAELAEAEDCYGQAWHFAGPGPISGIDFITRVYRAAGRAPKYRTVGPGLMKILGWFKADYAEVQEMMYLQETPVLLDDSKLLARFPETRKTPYDEGIRATLQPAGGPRV
ncbi:MAG TPA: NAD(P)H-binding protein [Bryobacteraceae bacterium]|jgi:nucleoside-diphosphate-sugar epimerase|nr:NAD(P)H-binding protein [Bryobacteraceae bacterium]